MDKILYTLLKNYYRVLSRVGYKSITYIHKLLVLEFIYELTQGDFKTYISAEDKNIFQRLLYQLFNTTCEITLPELCNCNDCKSLSFYSSLSTKLILNNIKQPLVNGKKYPIKNSNFSQDIFIHPLDGYRIKSIKQNDSVVSTLNPFDYIPKNSSPLKVDWEKIVNREIDDKYNDGIVTIYSDYPIEVNVDYN